MANSENRITSLFGNVSNVNQSIGSPVQNIQQNQILLDVEVLAGQLSTNLTKLGLSDDGIEKLRREVENLVSDAKAGESNARIRGRLLSIREILNSAGGNLLSSGILAMLEILIAKI